LTHGVARLHTYFDMLSEGRINPTPEVRVVHSLLSTATVDGDNGLGLVVAPQANRIAVDMAEKAGSGWVSVRNTNHFGIAGYYVLQALERDLIGWAMTNTTKLVAPLWGAERMLGTNPIAIAFPGKEEPAARVFYADPFVDMHNRMKEALVLLGKPTAGGGASAAGQDRARGDHAHP
jgi:LDH2 family malate/lactate/ureidoglycolate dehydrogenase